MRERILLVVPFLAPGLTNPPVWAQVTPPRAVDAHFGRRPTSRRPGMRGLRYSLLSLLLAVSGWTSQIWNFFLNSPLDFLDYFMINLSCELRGSGARREGRTAGLSDFGISGWEWGQREQGPQDCGRAPFKDGVCRKGGVSPTTRSKRSRNVSENKRFTRMSSPLRI